MYDFFDNEEVFEIDSDAIDNIVLEIANMAEIDDRRTSIIVPQRIMQLLLAYKIIKQITYGTTAEVTYTLHEPYKSMGYISIITDSLEITNIDLFKKVINLASNFEVYAKTDGNIQMNFTFHGLTKPIE